MTGVKKKKNAPKKPRSKSEVLSDISEIEQQISHVTQELQAKVNQFELLIEFSKILGSTLDSKVIKENALEATCQLVGCETASIFLVDKASGELYWETALGEEGKKLQKIIRLPIDNQSIAGYVAMTGESSIVNDTQKDIRHSKKTKGESKFQTKNMLSVPLKVKGKVVGVLQALNKLQCYPERPLGKAGCPDFYVEDLKLLESLSFQVASAIENALLYEQLKIGLYDTCEALAESIEKKDHFTGGHSKRVVHYSMCVAKYMDLSEEELERVRIAAILHDIGKIGIEDKILKKAAPLDQYEWPIMKTHPQLGYEIMKRVGFLSDVTPGMLYHHERWDGKGYPKGLKGEEIPMIARVIAVADTYDAMISSRPYREGLDPQFSYDEIVKNSGKQFCPQVVKAFMQAFVHEKMNQKTKKAAS